MAAGYGTYGLLGGLSAGLRNSLLMKIQQKAEKQEKARQERREQAQVLLEAPELFTPLYQDRAKDIPIEMFQEADRRIQKKRDAERLATQEAQRERLLQLLKTNPLAGERIIGSPVATAAAQGYRDEQNYGIEKIKLEQRLKDEAEAKKAERTKEILQTLMGGGRTPTSASTSDYGFTPLGFSPPSFSTLPSPPAAGSSVGTPMGDLGALPVSQQGMGLWETPDVRVGEGGGISASFKARDTKKESREDIDFAMKVADFRARQAKIPYQQTIDEFNMMIKELQNARSEDDFNMKKSKLLKAEAELVEREAARVRAQKTVEDVFEFLNGMRPIKGNTPMEKERSLKYYLRNNAGKALEKWPADIKDIIDPVMAEITRYFHPTSKGDGVPVPGGKEKKGAPKPTKGKKKAKGGTYTDNLKELGWN